MPAAYHPSPWCLGVAHKVAPKHIITSLAIFSTESTRQQMHPAMEIAAGCD